MTNKFQISKSKKINFNADDFGRDKPTNQKILDFFKSGQIDSASLMINMPAAAEAVKLARKNPKLRVGLHLNLTKGKPVSKFEEVKSLLGRDSRFLGWFALGKKLTLGQIKIEELKKEIRAQIKKFLSFGLKINHLDSHHHIHIHSTVFKILLPILKEYKVKNVRLGKKVISPRTIKGKLITAMYQNLNKSVEKAGLSVLNQVIDPDWFKAVPEEIIKKLPEGKYEIILHPRQS